MWIFQKNWNNKKDTKIPPFILIKNFYLMFILINKTNFYLFRMEMADMKRWSIRFENDHKSSLFQRLWNHWDWTGFVYHYGFEIESLHLKRLKTSKIPVINNKWCRSFSYTLVSLILERKCEIDWKKTDFWNYNFCVINWSTWFHLKINYI